MHHPTDRITHTTAFVTPVVEHWLEREIAQWVYINKSNASRCDYTFFSKLSSFISLFYLVREHEVVVKLFEADALKYPQCVVWFSVVNLGKLFIIFIIIHTYLILAQQKCYTTWVIKNHATAELSPLLDICGAIRVRVTYTLILGSKFTEDKLREVLPVVGGRYRLLCCH